MKNALNGKVVVITGASSGIGEAMARLYSKMGAKVVLGARNEEKLSLLTQIIQNEGGEAAYRATDVTKEEDCKQLIDKVGPAKAFLTHMSHEIGLHAEAEARLPEGVYLAYDGLSIDIK